MIDHVFLPVIPSQLDSTIAWYRAALAPLGYVTQIENPGQAVGLGPAKGTVPIWITAKKDVNNTGLHLAFKANDQETVDRFHEEAIKAGGTSDGEPGYRVQYHPTYYAAFVLDLMGNSVEVVHYSF